MTYRVTIAANKRDIVLPNGNRYQAGAVVDLSDEEYSQLTPGALATLISATTYLGQAVTRTVFIASSASNVVLPNLQRYNGGAMVVLSDEDYSTIPASAKAALFASDTAGGLSVPAPRLAGTVAFSPGTVRAGIVKTTTVLAGTVAFGGQAVNSTRPATLAGSVTFPARTYRADQNHTLASALATSASFPAPAVTTV